MITLANSYRFCDFHDHRDWQAPLLTMMRAHDLRGTILLAPEGINIALAGARPEVDHVLDVMMGDARFADLSVFYTDVADMPFGKAKVKLKKEIIAFGHPTAPQQKTGTQLDPKAWDALLAQPDVQVLDTRNAYETHLGSFQGAIDPQVDDFREITARLPELLPDKSAPVAMYCTGGVRCEKLSSWMLDQGYQHLYQLEGGIIRYLDETAPERSNWRGDCYVFDERIGVGHGNRANEGLAFCRACGHPLRPADRARQPGADHMECRFCRTA